MHTFVLTLLVKFAHVKAMKIKTFMHKNVVSLDLDRTLLDVKHIFDRTSFHHLLITEFDRLVDVVSDRDFLKTISPNVGSIDETQADRNTLKRRVNVIMSHKLITLSPEDDFFDAVALFHQHKISCIPIVDEEKFIKGIVSWRDLMKVIIQRQKYIEANNKK